MSESQLSEPAPGAQAFPSCWGEKASIKSVCGHTRNEVRDSIAANHVNETIPPGIRDS